MPVLRREAAYQWAWLREQQAPAREVAAPIWLLLTLAQHIRPSIYIEPTLSSFSVLEEQKFNYAAPRREKMSFHNCLTQDGAIECRIVLQFCSEKNGRKLWGKGRPLTYWRDLCLFLNKFVWLWFHLRDIWLT